MRLGIFYQKCKSVQDVIFPSKSRRNTKVTIEEPLSTVTSEKALCLIPAQAFLCGVYIFLLCSCGFSPSPVSQSKNTHIWVELETQNVPGCVLISAQSCDIYIYPKLTYKNLILSKIIIYF